MLVQNQWMMMVGIGMNLVKWELSHNSEGLQWILCIAHNNQIVPFTIIVMSNYHTHLHCSCSYLHRTPYSSPQ